MILGILGGIGSGKTTVARMFAELGAEMIEADRWAHEALQTPSARRRLLELLGAEAFRPDGDIDRAAVARRAFDDERILRRLEEIVHPEVIHRIEKRLDAVGSPGPTAPGGPEPSSEPTLILDVPLLLSTSLEERCDFLVFVDAPLEVRKERARARGWGAGEVERRERFQPSPEEKRRLADFVILNAGCLEETRRQVEECHARMTKALPARRESRKPSI